MKRNSSQLLLYYFILLFAFSGCAPSVRWNANVINKYKSEAIHIDTQKLGLPYQDGDHRAPSVIALFDRNLYLIYNEVMYKASIDDNNCTPILEEIDYSKTAVQYETSELILWNKTKNAIIRVYNLNNGKITTMNDIDKETLDMFRGNPVVLNSIYYFCRLKGEDTFEIVKYDLHEFTILSSFTNPGGYNYDVNLYTNGSLLYWIENRDNKTYLAEYNPKRNIPEYYSIDCDRAINPYIDDGDLLFIKATKTQKGYNNILNYALTIQRNFRDNSEQETLVDFNEYSPYDSDPLSWNVFSGHNFESSGYFHLGNNTLYRIKDLTGRLRFNPQQGAVLTQESDIYVFPIQ